MKRASVAALLAVAVRAAPARADTPDLAPLIHFDGLPNCLDERALERRVVPLVRPDRLDPQRRVEGSVELEGPGPVVQFRVFEGEALIGTRRLEFERPDCGPFRETVEVVVALLLEGHGFDEPPEASPPEPPAPAPPPPPPPAASPPPPPAPRPSKSERVAGHFRIGGELSIGVLPTPTAGLRLEGGVELVIPLALMARATWHLTSDLPIDGGGRLEVGGYRLAATACYLYRPKWVLSLCAGLGFVALGARAVEVPGARGESFEEAAAVLGTNLSIPVASTWSVELGGELETWFSRPEYVLIEPAGPRALSTASGVPVLFWASIGYTF